MREILRAEVNRLDEAAIKHAADALNKRICRVNKRSAVALEEVSVDVARRYRVDRARGFMGSLLKSVAVADMVIRVPDVDAVVVPGWSLIGLLVQADESSIAADNVDSRMFVRLRDDDDLDVEAFRTRRPVCDDCRRAIRRKVLFVVRDPHGAIKTMGGKCVESFIPKAHASFIGLLEAIGHFERLGRSSDDDGEGWAQLEPANPSPEDVVMATMLWTTRHPFIGRSRAGWDEQPTADVVWRYLTSARAKCPAHIVEGFEKSIAATDMDALEARALAVLERCRTLPTDGGDYERNLRAAAHVSNVAHRTLGVLVSAPAYFERLDGQARKEAERPESFHLPLATGKTHDIGEGEVVAVRPFESMYGDDGVRLVIRLDSGAELVGFLSTWPTVGDRDAEPGDRVIVRAHLKKHDEFKGRKQNVINRVRLTAAAR